MSRVIECIREDINRGDMAALDELLRYVPRKLLVGYLPEEEWKKWNKK